MAQYYTYQNASACSSFITLCQARLSCMSEINLWIDVQVQVTAEINLIEFILLCLNIKNKCLCGSVQHICVLFIRCMFQLKLTTSGDKCDTFFTLFLNIVWWLTSAGTCSCWIKHNCVGLNHVSVCSDYSRDANFVCDREVLQTKGQPNTLLHYRDTFW